MNEADLPAADELRRLAGWNQTVDDWRLLLSFEPNGCFVAIEDSKVVGTVTTTTYGSEMAWIGMMLVHPEHRRHGIGTRLMHAALDYLKGRGIQCIRLDATPAGQPVYEKLGFVSEWSLTRHQGAITSRKKAAKLTEIDWPALEGLDSAAFGVNRGRILRSLAAGSRAVLLRAEGFGMLRPGSNCDYLGPLVGAGPDLLTALLDHSGGRAVFWDVPDENAVATELARRFGFQPVRPLTRMRLGPNSVKSDPCAQLAIADPSLG